MAPAPSKPAIAFAGRSPALVDGPHDQALPATAITCREHALHCREIITETAGLAAKLMLLHSDELSSLTFGATVERLEEPPSVS